MTARDETRRRILHAANAMLERFGPVKTNIADIARELHMSPANIYNFFPSKDALLEELGENHFAILRQTICAGLAAEPDPWRGICGMFMDIARDIRKRIGNEKDVIQLQILAVRDGWKFIHNFHGFVLATLEQQIRILIGQRALHGLDPCQAALALCACMAGALEPVLILNYPSDDHERRLRAQLALLERAFSPATERQP